MKKSIIAKSVLALGIIATGVAGEYTQASAATKAVSQQNDLKNYYSKNFISTTATIEEMTGDSWELLFKIQGQDQRAQVKTSKEGFTKGEEVNAFLVREGTTREATTRSIGGITKNLPGHEYISINIQKSENVSQEDGMDFVSQSGHSEHIFLFNEEVTLKELDFRIRQLLIKKHGLYDTHNTGSIVVNDRSNGKYTFELEKKLQENRMDYTIKSGSITGVTVTLNK